MNEKVAIIQNPLAFMVENYMKNKVLLNEYANTKVYLVLKNPHLNNIHLNKK